MKFLSTPIFENNIARVGIFRCSPEHHNFHNTGPIRHGHLMVFPRTSVRILLPEHEPIVATPHTIMFYNAYQHYRREPLSADGDRCEWFAFAPSLLAAALRARDPEADIAVQQPFHWTNAQSNANCYLQQRLIVTHLLQTDAQGDPPDDLWLEEALHQLLASVLDQIDSQSAPRPRNYQRNHSLQTAREHRLIVRAVQARIGANFTQPLMLEDLATDVHLSPYELCRIFRKETTTTIHRYITQLRMRAALEAVADPKADLTTIALDLGYNSHSHFTSAFRRTFGVVPSALRKVGVEANYF